MSKTILLLLDACRFDAITATGGYLEKMIESNLGAKYRIEGELPSMSRPMYETLMTGLTATQHGIVNNQIVRRSRCPNLFSLCKQQGLVTAAAAYHWYSDLHGVSPFTHDQRYQLDGQGDIMYGIYYYEDPYPDSHLFMDGEFLRKTYNPDFLLMHSMNIDLQGHLWGGESKQYYAAVQAAAEYLSPLIPQWVEQGWQVVLTADHGMNSMGSHGGPTPEQRTIPLYLFGTGCRPGDFTEEAISQLNIAPLLCRLLGLDPAPGMLRELQIRIDGSL